MTKVRLKLMFFVLISLLTSVNGRPHSNEKLTKFGVNNTFHIPVDAEYDTLIVDDEDTETEEETNLSSKKELASIMDAEQNRDEKIVKKTMDQSFAVLELPKDNVHQFQKQLNISSPILEEIFDAETGREETLTGILFRPNSDIYNADFPKFEFLISKNKTYDSNSEVKNASDVTKKVDFVELVELVKPTKVSENKSAYTLANITGHYLENDAAPDTSFTDLQTVFVACIGTLLPLLIVLCISFLIRFLCRRYCKSWCKHSSVSSESESSDDKPENEQLKSSEGEEGANVIDPGEGSNEVPPANGSIITMTLKNNHLIVETEERNDITKNGRETKMKYSPDNDGIFVVEVQQSAAYRPINTSIQNSSPHDPQISTNQALIHRVPEDLERSTKMTKSDLEDHSPSIFDKEKTLALSNTGLSISDLSMSSIGSHNASYSYGSQMGYEQGPFGYPVYAGYEIPKEPSVGENLTHDNSREPLISRTPTDPDRPVITAAIFKQDSIIGNDVLQGPGYCIEGSSDGPLLSDVQAREVSLQQLHDKMEKKLENGAAVLIADEVESPKKTLNRADSLPVRIEENNEPSKAEPVVVMDVIQEVDLSPKNKEIQKGKRASLPIIRTEVYESVKDAIKPSGSPKFEKLTNEQSPSGEPLPMITISEEVENIGKEISS